MINPSLAFTPAQVIEDPERFAGRQRELDELSEALQISGGHIMIYGNRGIGKSSLAQQLMLMSQGHATLTDRLTHNPFVNFDFLPVYLQCDDSIKSVEDLLLRLLTTQTGLADWIPFSVEKVESLGGVSGGLTVKIAKINATSESKFVEGRPEIKGDIFSVFLNAINSILQAKISDSGLLIVIDEFDRIEDRTSLASMLKSLDPRVKFAIVGVSTNVAELIGEHESVARQFTGGCVKVDPMSWSEINDLFDRAQLILEDQVSFPKETRIFISGLAKGHPFLVHLLGRISTITAVRNGNSAVSVDAVKDALADIALKGTAPIQEDLYKKAVRNSYVREVILKEFAVEDDEEIRTTSVYQRITERLGLPDSAAISVYMGQLTSDRYGSVLTRPRDRYYRFKDSLFKAYAAARPFLLTSGSTDPED